MGTMSPPLAQKGTMNDISNGLDHSSDTAPSRPLSASTSSIHLHVDTRLDSSPDTVKLNGTNRSKTTGAKNDQTVVAFSPITTTSKSPMKPHHGGTDYFARRTSQDRRIRSEGFPMTRSERSSSLIGTKASVVTGGYESSDSDMDEQPLSAKSRATLPISQSFSSKDRPHFLNATSEKRKRSQSLMSPMTEVEEGRYTSAPMVNYRPRSNSRKSSREPKYGDGLRRSSMRAQSDVPEAGPSRLRQEIRQEPKSSPSKGKNRMDDLTMSLGIGGRSGDAILTPDQINQLLTDSDVSTALRMIQGQDSRLHQVNSISSQSTDPRSTHREPFIPQAPPPLLQDKRARANSVDSDEPPRRVNYTKHAPLTSHTKPLQEEKRQRARTMSRLDTEGGHVPFTHPVTISPPEDAQSVTTASSHTDNGLSPEKTRKLRKEALGGKNRLSQLFHIKRKPSVESLKRSNTEHREDKEEKDRSKAREKERLDREAERKRIEQERREAELSQERRFRALTQVAAHPQSERKAYHASSHLRAYYNQIYQGVEALPPVNPLAVLRWKHRTEEQNEARLRWEKSAGELGAMHDSPVSWRQKSSEPGSEWMYTVEDVQAYDAAGGVVNYFVPPRPAIAEPTIRPTSPPRSISPIVEGSVASGTPRISASVVSLANPPSTLSNEPLSRSPSNDVHRRTHRHHPSLSSMGPHALSHALKAPYEKLVHAARQKRAETAPFPQTDDERNDSHKRSHSMGRRDWRQDENREFHLRKLFIKGQREARKPEIETDKVQDRDEELRSLERTLARETAFRERQVEVERQTAQEAEARERMRHLEDEIYLERGSQLVKAKQRLERFQADLDGTSESVKHCLAQIDQLTSVAKITAEVDMHFPNLVPIRLANAKKVETKASRGEAADVLGPLRNVYESGSDSGSRRPSRQNSLAKRKSTLPLLSVGIKPWPRRMSLDPDGVRRVDPITRTGLTIEYGRNHLKILMARRDDALGELQKMLTSLDSLVKQKDAVRSWTKSALERNRNLKSARDALHAEIEGNTSARLARIYDTVIDRAARLVAWPFMNLILSFTGWMRWAASRRSQDARRNYKRSSGGRVGSCCWLVVLVVGVSILASFWWGDRSEL